MLKYFNFPSHDQLNMGVSVTQQSLTKQFKQNNALLWDYFKSVAIEDGNKYIFSQN